MNPTPHRSPDPGVPVAIGLGTNLGDRRGNLRHAIGRIAEVIDGLRCSSIWASEAMLLPGAPAHWAIPFLNAVVVGRTGLGAHDLLDALQRTELELGRGPHAQWAPRSIDLDLLLYGEYHITDARLQVPHPGITERPFVLLPLAELWPARRLPGDGSPLEHRAAEYRARHPHGLPFHARPAREEPPIAVGA